MAGSMWLMIANTTLNGWFLGPQMLGGFIAVIRFAPVGKHGARRRAETVEVAVTFILTCFYHRGTALGQPSLKQSTKDWIENPYINPLKSYEIDEILISEDVVLLHLLRQFQRALYLSKMFHFDFRIIWESCPTQHHSTAGLSTNVSRYETPQGSLSPPDLKNKLLKIKEMFSLSLSP